MKNNKLLLLGSIVSPCPPSKQGGTERVAYVQGKFLAKKGIKIIFVGAKNTTENFKKELLIDNETDINSILNNIEFVEIGGGTAMGNQQDSINFDKKTVEASRKLRLEMVNLSKIQKLMMDRKSEYDVILNNLRGEAALLSTAYSLNKKFVNVCHLNIFSELAELFKYYNTYIIPIANHQKKLSAFLNYLPTINNPVNTSLFSFNNRVKNYALMMGTIGYHKNQTDAIKACLQANIPLVLSGKIRDQDYFNLKIKPFIDNKKVIYYGELEFEEKLKLYQEAKVFLFPILWQEPFGLVVIESLSTGTPVIAYPNGGPAEIIKNGDNGYLVNNYHEMAKSIENISKIDRQTCRETIVSLYDEKIIGQQYYQVLSNIL